MELIEKYYLIVSGCFDREPLVFDNFPSEEEIKKTIIKLKGISAKVEKRYVLTQSVTTAN